MMKWVRSMTKTKTRSEQQKKPRLRFVFTWHDFGIFLSMLSFATILCYFLRTIDDSDVYVALIFELTVVLVSRFTDGYLFGLLSSVVGVIGINYIFTFPYYQLNFTISGYPLTFLVMLIVSVVVSTLTTQIKQQEKIRAEAEKEKMRGNLLRAVSHDIRTPLTSIVGGVSTLLDSGDQLDEATRTQLLENIRDESNWLVSVVENLLSVTRMTGEQTKIKKEMQLRKEGENARFEVADNGQGIAREVFPKLFKGYLSHDEELTADGRRNMGIGLSVCMSIVQAHGGTMQAENREIGGALFSFTLPLEERNYEDPREDSGN